MEIIRLSNSDERMKFIKITAKNGVSSYFETSFSRNCIKWSSKITTDAQKV